LAQHIVALDLGATAAHIAVIAATFRRARVLDVRSIPVPPGQPLSQTMATIRETIGVPIDNLVCGLDARRASVHAMQFPFTDVRRAAQAVEFELENRVPFDMDQTVVSWRTTDIGPRNMHALAAVTPKAPLAAELAEMAAAGLEPRAVMHPAVALQELLRNEPEMQPNAEHGAAILCVGATQAHLCVVRGKLRFVRSLRFGSDTIDHALARALELEAEAARTLRETQPCLLAPEQLSQATAEARRVHTAMVAALDPLVSGLFTTLKTLEPQDRPHRILLTGSASHLEGLEDYLHGRLGITVDHLVLKQSLSQLETRGRTFMPAHALVLAMAQSLFRHGQDVPFNFRHGDLAYKGDLQLYRGQLTRAAVAVACIFALAGVHATTRWVMLRAEERDVNLAFCKVTEKVIGRQICDPTTALATMRESQGQGTVIPSFSASAMLQMLSKRVPKTVDVQFDELDLRVDATPGQPERIMGRGEAATFETIEQLVSLIKADPCVQDAEVSKQRKSQNQGRVEFSLTIKVLCPTGQRPGASVGPNAGPSAT
jgi:general secretion pathway protein L